LVAFLGEWGPEQLIKKATGQHSILPRPWGDKLDSQPSP
jgi:hypothetical protein